MTRAFHTFSLRTRLVWGPGVLAELGKETARLGQRAMLILSKTAAQKGLSEQIQANLESGGLTYTLMVATGEPTLTSLAQGLSLAREFGAQVVVAAGGGSVMDLGKAVAGLYHEPGAVLDYFYGKPISKKGIPLVTVPTVFGSGAEVTPNAVLSDQDKQVKQSIRHPDFAAATTMIDPLLSLDLPASITAFAGLDGLCQAIEALTSRGANPLTDVLAFDAAVRFAQALPGAVANGHDLAARESLAIASTMGGIALAAARLGAVHGLAHPIGIRYHQPHGKVCAVFLPVIMRYNLPAAQEKYAQLYRRLNSSATTAGSDCDQALALIEFVETILRQLGIPLHLRELGLPPDELESVIAEGMPSGSMQANPRPVVPGELLQHLTQYW